MMAMMSVGPSACRSRPLYECSVPGGALRADDSALRPNDEEPEITFERVVVLQKEMIAYGYHDRHHGFEWRSARDGDGNAAFSEDANRAMVRSGPGAEAPSRITVWSRTCKQVPRNVGCVISSEERQEFSFRLDCR